MGDAAASITGVGVVHLTVPKEIALLSAGQVLLQLPLTLSQGKTSLQLTIIRVYALSISIYIMMNAENWSVYMYMYPLYIRMNGYRYK